MQTTMLIQFAIGFVALIVGAEFLVRGAARLAGAVGISPIVIGLTVVAFATSAPELAVGIESTRAGQSSIALGNIIGSNIFNILFILGLAALVNPLVVHQRLVRLDVPLMIALSAIVFVFCSDGVVSQLEGLALIAGAVGYNAFAIWQSRRESREIEESYEEVYGSGRFTKLRNLFFIAIGLLLLILGGDWLVDSASTLARAFGISELIIGLTIVAVGTSLPEAATSIIASRRGERDIAAGNAVGSNIFNLLVVLGVCSFIAPAGILVPTAALRFDLPVMLAVAIACLPIFFNGYRISRWEGALLFGYYVAYTLFLLLNATQHEELPRLSAIMLTFVVPLTVITLAVITFRAWRLQRVR